MVTGTWRSRYPVYKRRRSPCWEACPAGNEIPKWIQLSKDNLYQAWEALVVNNPFPAVTGRVCHHPCEKACNRLNYDEPLAINALEQYIGDQGLLYGWPLPAPQKDLPEHVAVVGGGPAGLSCAYQLRQKGYRVTVFESRQQLGGVLRSGIPGYRLPKKALDQEIQRLLALKIEVQLGKTLGKDLSLQELSGQYAAVFLATGAQQAKKLSFEQVNGVWDGMDFLAKVNLSVPLSIGSRVVVAGGGSSAMDVARVARRLGADVKVIVMEARAEMPAIAAEIEQALAEGIKIYNNTVISALESKDGKLTAVRCLGYPGGGGEFRLETSALLVAIGQDIEVKGLEDLLASGQPGVPVDDHLSTVQPGVFAGGDLITLQRSVVGAIGSGKKAAQSIQDYLGTKQAGKWQGLWETRAHQEKSVEFPEINTFYFLHEPRAVRGLRTPGERITDFQEVLTGLTGQAAGQEAGRCFSCGSCLQCDNCYNFCPDLAVGRFQAGEYQILDRYCKGCGVCAEECPCGVVVLEEERR